MNALANCKNTETASFAQPFGAFQWIARSLNSIARAYGGRRVLRDLARSDDRMLKDIGLARSDLRSAAAEPLFRDPTELLAGHVDEVRPRRRARARKFIAELDCVSRKSTPRYG